MSNFVGCPHRHKQLARLIARNGTVHVQELCTDCGDNTRGPGRWVPHHELRVPLDSLPVASDHRPAPGAPRQRDLFGETP